MALKRYIYSADAYTPASIGMSQAGGKDIKLNGVNKTCLKHYY